MITVRQSLDRGHANHGWLDSFHSFSFAEYLDPAHMGVGNLRVLNEDRIAPGTGFGTHGHRDMEIVSYVLSGALAHKDDTGAAADANAGVIRVGDVQRMSAGTGVRHSEFNHSSDELAHFLQIWILPSETGLAPSYAQRRFSTESKRGRLCLVASPDGGSDSLALNADASIRVGLFDVGESFELTLDPRRLAYVHVARGHIEVNGHRLSAGDAATVSETTMLRLQRGDQAEVLVFDLAP